MALNVLERHGRGHGIMLRIAVVGAGYIGKLHATTLSRNIEKARVVAVVDTAREVGEDLAREVGATFYQSYDSMLSNADVDTVAICTPTFLHAEMVLKAANAGKNIFCEKPLALTIQEADLMINAVAGAKVKAMVGHVLRFWPEYVRVKSIVDSGELGRPRYGFFERLLTIPNWAEGDWNRKEELGGGAGLDVQIHDLDFASWLFGRVKKVNAHGVYDSELGGWAHVATSIEFESGQSCLTQVGWALPDSFPFTTTARILCENGVVEWLFRSGRCLEERAKSPTLMVYKSGGTVREDRVEPIDPFVAEWQYFTDRVDSGAEIENATFEDGRDSLNLALASQLSAKEGRAIEIR